MTATKTKAAKPKAKKAAAKPAAAKKAKAATPATKGWKAGVSRNGVERPTEKVTEQLLGKVGKAADAVDAAKEQYRLSILEAYDAGVTTVLIARTIGITPSAVHTFIKRNR